MPVGGSLSINCINFPRPALLCHKLRRDPYFWGTFLLVQSVPLHFLCCLSCFPATLSDRQCQAPQMYVFSHSCPTSANKHVMMCLCWVTNLFVLYILHILFESFAAGCSVSHVPWGQFPLSFLLQLVFSSSKSLCTVFVFSASNSI